MAISSKFKKDWGSVMKKVQESTGRSSGGKDERFYKIDLGDTGSADVTIRFLPSKDTDVPWATNFNHTPRGIHGWANIPCPKQIGRKKCPICDYVWLNFSKTASKEENSKYLRYLASQRFIINILVIKDVRHPENEGKVFLYDLTKQIYDKFDEFHKEYAEAHDGAETYIWDWVEGHDFRLKAKAKTFTNDKGEKITAPNYETAYFVDDQSPVGTEEYMEKISDQMYNLAEYVNPDRFMDDESMIAKFEEITDISIGVKKSEPEGRKESSRGKDTEDRPPKKEAKEEDDDSFVIADDDADDSDSFFDDI